MRSKSKFGLRAVSIAVSMALALLSMTVIILGTGLLLGATWGDPVAVAAFGDWS